MNNKISIITAVFNGENYLQRFLDSVANQDYANFELIIIDGGSKDSSVEIIRRNISIINYWISEPDKGIYDAWNKGIAKSSGQWIMFLGSDDVLLPSSLSNYINFILTLDASNLDYISSQVQMIDSNGKYLRKKGGAWEWPFFLKEMTVAHPGSLHSIKLFDTYGKYDITYKITGDYEFLLRPRAKLNAAFMPMITVLMTEGGASDSISAIKEHKRAALQTGGASKFSVTLNFWLVYIKFKLKKLFRSFGIYIYLK